MVWLPTSAGVGDHDTLIVRGPGVDAVPDILTVAPVRLPPEVVVKIFAVFWSDTVVVKFKVLPGHTRKVSAAALKEPPVTPLGVANDGEAFVQLPALTSTCISRIVEPINTPLRYSRTIIATTPFCMPTLQVRAGPLVGAHRNVGKAGNVGFHTVRKSSV